MSTKSIAALTLAMAFGGCGGAMAEPDLQAPPKAAGEGTAASPPGERVAFKAPRHTGSWVKVRGSEYGRVLVDARGRTLYLLDSERAGRSECYGECARAWPPLLSRGAPRARGEAEQRLLGRTRRHGGARQVTYRGHPLYRYAPEGPREILCQDVFEYGGTWLVVRPSGRPVR
jgi:predicted lipoprotein with Yx(FWY)xxD motif